MMVDLGEEPMIKQSIFTVIANIYSEKENHHVHEWLGGTFDSYDKAYEFWDVWNPPKKEIQDIMKKRREQGDFSHHELEIGVYSDDPYESRNLAFMNTTIDGKNERD